MIDWKNPSGKYTVETHYTIEYLNNIVDLQTVNKGRHPAPWELYKKKEFVNDAETAYNTFIIMSLNHNLYDVKMFKSVFVNGEAVEEETILIDSVNYNTIAKVLNEDLLNEVYKARKSADAVYKNAEAQKTFCEKYSKQFAEFLKNEYNSL